MRNVSINDRTTPLSPIIKSEPVNQDQPLDFSKRVRHSADDDSLRKVSEDSAVGDLGRKSPHAAAATPAVSESDHRTLIGEPRVGMPTINSFLPQTTMAAGMGMFYPGAHVFPNFMAPGFPPMWPNPMAAAAMMQQQQEAARKLLQQTASNKSAQVRQFGATRHLLGKDSLPFPAGIRNFPAIPPTGLMATNTAPSMMGNIVPDPTILAEALKSHEEMYNAYKQQVSLSHCCVMSCCWLPVQEVPSVGPFQLV